MGGEVLSVDDMPAAEMRQGAVEMGVKGSESRSQRPQSIQEPVRVLNSLDSLLSHNYRGIVR